MSAFSTKDIQKSDIKTSFVGDTYIRLSAVLASIGVSLDLWRNLIKADLIGKIKKEQDNSTWCTNQDARKVADILSDPEKFKNVKGMTPDLFAEIQRTIKDRDFILEIDISTNVFREISNPSRYLNNYSDLRRLTVHRYPMLLTYLGIDGILVPDSEDRLHRTMLKFFDRIYQIQDFFDPQLLCPGSINRYRESIDDVTTLLIEGLKSEALYTSEVTACDRVKAIHALLQEFAAKLAQITNALIEERRAILAGEKQAASQRAAAAVGTAATIGLLALFSN